MIYFKKFPRCARKRIDFLKIKKDIFINFKDFSGEAGQPFQGYFFPI